MAFWLNVGPQSIGLDDGIIRQADLAYVVEACRLSEAAENLRAQAAEESENIIQAAHQEAADIHSAAELEAEQICQTAFTTGMEDAANTWTEEVTARALEAHESLQRSSERLAGLVGLAAQRVIETEDREGLYRRALRTVTQMARESKTLTLYVGPGDHSYAESVVAGIAKQVGIELPIEVKVDMRLADGGCMFESDQGVLDASLGIQLDTIKGAITKAALNALRNSANNASMAEEASQHDDEEDDDDGT